MTDKELQDTVTEEFSNSLNLRVNVCYKHNPGSYLVIVRVPDTYLLRQPETNYGAYYTFCIGEDDRHVTADAYHPPGYFFYKDKAGDIMRLSTDQRMKFNLSVREAIENDLERRAKLLADTRELAEYLRTQHLTNVSVSSKPGVNNVKLLRFTLNGQEMCFGFDTTDGEVDYVTDIESFIGKPLAYRSKQLLKAVWHLHFGLPYDYVMEHEMPF